MVTTAARLRQVTQELQELGARGEGLTVVLTPERSRRRGPRSGGAGGPAAAGPARSGPPEACARLLAVWLARAPGLAALTAMGWDPASDEPPTPWDDPGSSP